MKLIIHQIGKNDKELDVDYISFIESKNLVYKEKGSTKLVELKEKDWKFIALGTI